jgi:hemoglobin
MTAKKGSLVLREPLRLPPCVEPGGSVDVVSNGGVDRSVYDAVGGRPFFDALVDGFYDGVSADRLLRPLYPEDLTESRRHLAGFLTQYWGGPSTYSDERGHPRLRMRHAPFAIGDAEREAWLHHMLGSLEAVAAARGTPGEAVARIRVYLTDVAEFLVNTR